MQRVLVEAIAHAHQGAAPHERLHGRKVALLRRVQQRPVLLVALVAAPEPADGRHAREADVLVEGLRAHHDVRELHRGYLEIGAHVDGHLDPRDKAARELAVQKVAEAAAEAAARLVVLAPLGVPREPALGERAAAHQVHDGERHAARVLALLGKVIERELPARESVRELRAPDETEGVAHEAPVMRADGSALLPAVPALGLALVQEVADGTAEGEAQRLGLPVEAAPRHPATPREAAQHEVAEGVRHLPRLVAAARLDLHEVLPAREAEGAPPEEDEAQAAAHEAKRLLEGERAMMAG